MHLALNTLQRLICLKLNKPNQTVKESDLALNISVGKRQVSLYNMIFDCTQYKEETKFLSHAIKKTQYF